MADMNVVRSCGWGLLFCCVLFFFSPPLSLMALSCGAGLDLSFRPRLLPCFSVELRFLMENMTLCYLEHQGNWYRCLISFKNPLPQVKWSTKLLQGSSPVVCMLQEQAVPTQHGVFCAITSLRRCKGLGFTETGLEATAATRGTPAGASRLR